jgi:hypothetical protein
MCASANQNTNKYETINLLYFLLFGNLNLRSSSSLSSEELSSSDRICRVFCFFPPPLVLWGGAGLLVPCDFATAASRELDAWVRPRRGSDSGSEGSAVSRAVAYSEVSAGVFTGCVFLWEFFFLEGLSSFSIQ